MNTQLIKRNPFDELRNIQNRLTSFFGDGETDDGKPTELALANGEWMPAVDVAEDDDEFKNGVLTVHLPKSEEKKPTETETEIEIR